MTDEIEQEIINSGILSGKDGIYGGNIISLIAFRRRTRAIGASSESYSASPISVPDLYSSSESSFTRKSI